jgi:hypothetical protein
MIMLVVKHTVPPQSRPAMRSKQSRKLLRSILGDEDATVKQNGKGRVVRNPRARVEDQFFDAHLLPPASVADNLAMAVAALPRGDVQKRFHAATAAAIQNNPLTSAAIRYPAVRSFMLSSITPIL